MADTTKRWESTGKFSLNDLARSHGMTSQQLINISLASERNHELADYIHRRNYNLPVPQGVHLYFPAGHWAHGHEHRAGHGSR